VRPLHVRGVGLWRPTPKSLEAPCADVPSRLLRGTSAVTRIAIEVTAQAAREGGASLGDVPTVFASELGEVQTAVTLLAMIRAEAIPSPMRFKNSVHNAASGTASIAWQNTRFSTAISAGPDLVAMGLLEAWALVDLHGGDVVVSFAEEEIPAPLPRHGAYPALGVAFHLSTRPGGAHPVTLSALRLDASVPVATYPAGHEGDACAVALALLDAVTSRRAGAVSLSLDPSSPWCVDVGVSGP
jgi:hypothetical protein